VAAVVTLLSGCAARQSPQVVADLAGAHALTRQGCYRCLQDALAIYERVAARAQPPGDALRGAFAVAVLLVVRARELGLPHDIPLAAARAWAAKLESAGATTVTAALSPAAYLEALPLITGERSGLMPEDRERVNRERRSAWPANGDLPATRHVLSPAVATDVLAQYVALAIDCEDARARKSVHADEVRARYPYPLMHFRLGLCGIPELRLDSLRTTDPRWLDTLFFEGRQEMSRFPGIDVARAADLFAQAHDAFPESHAITLALGQARNALEEHASAAALFESILETHPTHRDALLGRVLSLSYLRRHYDAIRTATRMIDLGTYHMGDAFYWRAWNRYQVHDLPSAWTDVESATKLMVNTAVYTLAGFVAYAQRDHDVAIDRLGRAYRLDTTNCEAVWTEGLVHVDQQDWTQASARFVTAVGCFTADARSARDAIVQAQASTVAEAVKSRRVAAAQKRAASSDHRRAQSAFNAASSFLRLGQKAEALGHVEVAAEHPLLKDKAAALRGTIEKLP
jgi:tetratricopeptide (TPR) repeat protein